MNIDTMSTVEIEMHARALRAAFVRDVFASMMARLRGTRGQTTDTSTATV